MGERWERGEDEGRGGGREAAEKEDEGNGEKSKGRDLHEGRCSDGVIQGGRRYGLHDLFPSVRFSGKRGKVISQWTRDAHARDGAKLPEERGRYGVRQNERQSGNLQKCYGKRKDWS